MCITVTDDIERSGRVLKLLVDPWYVRITIQHVTENLSEEVREVHGDHQEDKEVIQ